MSRRIKERRPELEHNWSQGEYVQNSSFENRLNWDEVEQLEEHSLSFLDDLTDHRDCAVAWSGGVDILVIAHMLKRLGETDVPLINTATPEYFPTHLEYVEEIGEMMGFDVSMYSADKYDIDWLVRKKDRELWPNTQAKWDLITKVYHRGVEWYMEKFDADVSISGVRNEHNNTKKHLRDRPFLTSDQKEACPIFMWDIAHVLGYLDKYDLPIDPMYRHYPTGSGKWHSLKIEESPRPQHKVEKNWYRTRTACIETGYTDFWADHILNHFPEGEELAHNYAYRQNITIRDIEDGYSMGADAEPIIPDWFDG